MFVTLGGIRPTENFLSRLFVACFAESATFAECVLSAIWKACRLEGVVPESKNYVCDYQPATPDADGSRPDLCLRPIKGGMPSIYIESKVQSHLGEQQLLRYKNSGVVILVAITKNWPEVSRARLRELEINTLRWQDICRAIENTEWRGVKDAFLRGAFVKYLEDQKMAYREDIMATSLEQLSSTLARVSSLRMSSCVPKKGFQIADNCVAMLSDVIRLAREMQPELNEWTTWGPGYFKSPDSDTKVTAWNALGFEFYQKGTYTKRNILCALYFVLDEQGNADYVTWGVTFRGSQVPREREKDQQIENFMHKGKLDPGKMARQVLSAIREWEVEI